MGRADALKSGRRGHGTQPDHIVISPPVAHHAAGFHRQQHREGLPDVVLEAVVADFRDVDVDGETQDVELAIILFQ
jgi:hypothetical protein